MPTPNDEIIQKEVDYGTKALAYCKNTPDQKGNRPVIKPGTAEWSSWERYFVDFLGFTPHGMKMALWKQTKGMTVPAKWPEWFDSDYAKQQVGMPRND